jgi:hypothetical protein
MRRFRSWIEALDVEVIQGEYGYEPGEFAVFPEHWRPMYREGLTPLEAFRRALDASAEERREREAHRSENGRRIQEADARAIAATPPRPADGGEG